MEGDDALILYTFITRGPFSLESTVSSIARAWEEYPISEVNLLYASGVREDEVEIVKEWAARLLGGKSKVSATPVDSSPESLIGSKTDKLLDTLRRLFRRGCEEAGGVVIISSGSRRLASAASLAGVWGLDRCNLDVAHTYFYFGPWSGLPYPYTPLRLQPLIILNTVHGPSPRGESAAARFREPWAEPLYESLRGQPPPLRAAVGELARRINMLTPFSLVLPSEGEPRCGKLVIGMPDPIFPAADLCSEREMVNLASKIAGYLRFLEEHVGTVKYRSIMAWTGLAHLRVEDREEPLHVILHRGKTIIDSSLIYYGAHRYFWEGAELYIPECAIQEIHLAVAEAIKTRRRSKWEGLPAILAFLALKDLLGAGAPILPTTPGQCDTAIPKIDPVILEGRILASSDSGAIRYWKGHPARRIAGDIIKVYFDPDESVRQTVDPRNDPLSLPRLYYSIYQSILALALLDYFKQLPEGGPLRVYVLPGDGEKREVHVPLGHLLKAIGFTEKSRVEGKG